jgi:UPF0755 protein
MKVFKVLLFSILVFVSIAALSYVSYLRLIEAPLEIGEDFIFDVESGESMNGVIARMTSKGVIDKPWLAKIYIRHKGLARDLKAGEFTIKKSASLADVFEILTSNKQIKYRLTIVEGSTFSEARAVVASSEKLVIALEGKSDKDVLAILQGETISSNDSSALISEKQSLRFPHPEGSLYPDTYFYHKGDSDLSILKRAHQRLIKVLTEEWQNKSPKLPLQSSYEALILASIVEKETGKPSERGEIAGVFTRRLEQGMRLQTDPTVIYGLGSRYKGNITRKHLRELTPYNTYRINGLPPTPIALVGREAIHAAVNPLAGKSLYFVAKGDGSHQFSETITQHNNAVRKYQLKRRSDYRSSHQGNEN